ncbi:hypothetical protein J9303_18400, partial [Bacillaceae bacterium Marseille-Q3522]|nr:hypothetical protein [Bacillaceae bacterium Marseille-Q3522]
MNNQNEQSPLDRSLKRLEYDMEWKLERAQFIKQRLKRDLRKMKKKQIFIKSIYFSITFAFVAGFLFVFM